MYHYSFVRLADDKTIPIPADDDRMALGFLCQQESASLSLEGEGAPAYIFSKSEHHTFWCRPSIPVYRL